MQKVIALCVLFPFLLLAEIKADIEFVQRDGVPLKMDAFVPDGNGPFRAAIWVHGGGFVSGDKSPYPKNLLDELANKGWAWFSVNYRLAPKYPFPAQTDDVEAAVAYIKAHKADFRIDPKRLVLIGASAGGILFLLWARNTVRPMTSKPWFPFLGNTTL